MGILHSRKFVHRLIECDQPGCGMIVEDSIIATMQSNNVCPEGWQVLSHAHGNGEVTFGFRCPEHTMQADWNMEDAEAVFDKMKDELLDKLEKRAEGEST